LRERKETIDERVFCMLKSATTKITLGGDVKIVSRGPYPPDDKILAWVYSSQCPDNFYSVVKINKAGEVETEIDCHETTLEELSKESSLQWNVDEHAAELDSFNFAISGHGQFLVYCPEEKKFFLTRRGHFEFNEGLLQDVHGYHTWLRLL